MPGRVDNQGEPDFTRETLPPEAALDFLEDVKYICPCCDTEFTGRRVCVNKLTLLGYDSDLRPNYYPLDPVLYDVIICEKCGYGALAKTFDNLSFKSAQIIMSGLPKKFKNINYPLIYTEEIAIKRYENAVINALLTREKSGIIAYLYVKLAWIYRSIKDCKSERRMLLAALEGFGEALSKESFPIIDLSEGTTNYIMGDFFYRLNKNKQAKRYFKRALATGDIAPDLKRRILEYPFMNEN